MSVARKSFSLSDFTEGVWLDKGGVQLRRIKDIGENFDSGYKVYIPSTSLKAIIDRQDVIQDGVASIIDGTIESPHNIPLHKRQVMRLSYFYEHFYYGIHVLDVDEKVRIGKGMNLTEEEYQTLLEHVTQKINTDGEKKRNEEHGEGRAKNFLKRQAWEMTTGECSTGASKRRESDLDVLPIKSGLIIETSMFGWKWNTEVSTQFSSEKESDGQWHFCPKECFVEAMTFKPIDDDELISAKLDVFNKTEYVSINKAFLDVVVAKLIKFNVSLCAEQDKNSSIYSDESEDMLAYGRDVMDRVTSTDIYDLCKKTMIQYTKLNPAMELELMRVISSYQKSDSVLSDIRNNTINPLLFGLMNYIYPL